MAAFRKSKLKTPKPATNAISGIQAAIDPCGGVKKLKAAIDPCGGVKKMEMAIDPCGGVKKKGRANLEI